MQAQETLTTSHSAGRAIGDYVALMKPRIIALLLITTVVAMWMAAGGPVDISRILMVVLGGTLSAGAANALNMYIDRDIDAVMNRTRGRPVPSGRLEPQRALVFGVVTGAISFAMLWVMVNLLAAVLSLSALLFYVLIYTSWLKRATPQNIVIGGAAGAVPPLVGWAAVTGGVGLPAIILFLIIFLWTPPHFWALALAKKEDYARAKVPMLPVTHGEAEARKQIFIYTLITVISSLALYPLGVLGPAYLVAAAVLGAGFIWLSAVLFRDHSRRAAYRLFSYSIAYLALLFVVMVFDLRAL